jgi:polar amino acid transport system substrate-binding protein
VFRTSRRLPRASRRVALSAVAAAAALVALSACSSSAASTTHGLQTVTAGKITVATGQPAYSPWVIDNKPQTGQGFEAAVAYAVAKKLGFSKSEVKWVRTGFDAAIAPGAKDFDFNLQQFSITDQRKKAVDFSSPYYTTTQAIVAYKGTPVASAKSAADLKSFKIGVPAGTTSYDVLVKEVGGSPAVYNSEDDAVQALKSKQIDAIAVDLPAAFYITSAQLKNATVVGQFSDTSGGDQYGLVLAKNSPITKKVSAAVDDLRGDGTLASLEKKWLSDTVNVPTFK